jgi:predicted Zn-dependent protease with MMP-like domain
LRSATRFVVRATTRSGSAPVDGLRPVIQVSRLRFERLVRRAVEGLPPDFRERLDNLDIVVERRPSQRRLRQGGVAPGFTLLGLYQGIPQTHRGLGYSYALPDRIIIFQEPIEARCQTEDELVEQVRATVVHEIAHHFGIDDARLTELGRG